MWVGSDGRKALPLMQRRICMWWRIMRCEGGVVCITPAGGMTRVVAGVNLVGLAFGTHGDLILTDNSTVYKLAFGVQGRLLSP